LKKTIKELCLPLTTEPPECLTWNILEDSAPFMHIITTDNGKEFANHQQIAEQLGIDFYFATPYLSWELDANENLNGLVRQYFPKGTNFDTIDDQAVKEAVFKLNKVIYRDTLRIDYERKQFNRTKAMANPYESKLNKRRFF